MGENGMQSGGGKHSQPQAVLAPARKMADVRNRGVFGRFPELRALFLKHLARYGNVAAAAKHVRLSYLQVMEYVRAYPDFKEDLEGAVAEHHGKIDKAVHDRAIEGWEEPRFGQSGVVGSVRRYSDVLLLAYAKRHMREYRDGQHTTVGGKVEHKHTLDLGALTGQQRDALRLLLSGGPEDQPPGPGLVVTDVDSSVAGGGASAKGTSVAKSASATGSSVSPTGQQEG